ncbi:MAG: helix-turn-helix transcriptional regulator [Gammaproteobacteria bacterium]|nr:helix-turn-helix transcriptional regulator [Gammaproteobacteria bacterium]
MNTIELLKPLTDQHVSFQTEYAARELYKPFGNRVKVNDFWHVSINHRTKIIHFITTTAVGNRIIVNKGSPLNADELKPGIRYLAASDSSAERYKINKALNIYNTLEFTQKQGDITSMFGFGTSRRGPEVLNEYLANLHLFQQFIRNFEHDAKDILRITHLAPTPLLSNIEDKTDKNGTIILLDNNQSIKLSNREIEVLTLLSYGSSAKSSALKLGLSPRTIETHIESLKNKLNLRRKVDLIEFCLKKTSLRS